MIEIPLANGKGVALIDDAAAELVTPYAWSLGSWGYAKTKISGRYQSMQRLVVGLVRGDPREVDHKNLNRLDNRLENLRVLTGAQNSENRSKQQMSRPALRSSPFRGVCWYEPGKCWRSFVRKDGTLHYLGQFADDLDAALAAQAKRTELMSFAEPDPAIARAIEERK